MKRFLPEPYADFMSKCEGFTSEIIAVSELGLCPLA